jgi:hypothetical protein
MPMKRTPIRRVSKRRATLLPKLRRVVAEVLARDPICICCKKKPSEEAHHQKGRLGPLLLDKKFMIGLCKTCHCKVTRKVAWARRKKLTLLRY